MRYIVEQRLADFLAWSGACYTWSELYDRGDLGEVDEIIEAYYQDTGELPTETEINDLLWFERDTIANYLGYEDWEDYLMHKPKR